MRKSGYMIFYLFYVSMAICLFLLLFQKTLAPVVLHFFFLVVGLYVGNWIAYKSLKYMNGRNTERTIE